MAEPELNYVMSELRSKGVPVMATKVRVGRSAKRRGEGRILGGERG